MFDTKYFNKNVSERDSIIFGEDNHPKYTGGIARFDNLTVNQLHNLIDKRFANPDDYHNDSPTIQQFMSFMESYPGYTLIGYAVSIDRWDYSVQIDGIAKNMPITDKAEIADFAVLFKKADGFKVNSQGAYAWFD